MSHNNEKPPLWNTHQQQAMTALGLTLWRHSPNASTPTLAASAEASEPLHCYKAERWLFTSAAQLPVELPQWLNDLMRTVTGQAVRPSEVSAKAIETWPQEYILTISLEPLTPAAKKALWQRTQAIMS